MGKRIQSIMADCKLKQATLALSVDISQGYLSDIIRGVKTPSGTLIIAICEKYGYRRKWLEHGYGEKHENKAKTIDGPESEVVGSLQSKKYTEAEMDLIEKYANAKAEIAVLKKELEIERGLNQLSKTKGQESRKPGNP